MTLTGKAKWSLTFWVCVAPQLAHPSRIMHGKIVDPGQYPEVVEIKTDDGDCTATFISPRVLATAAHCGADQSTVRLLYKGNTYSAKVTHAPPPSDFALALVDHDLADVAPTNIGFKPKVWREVDLLGYGCTGMGEGGASDGKLRVGVSRIVELNENEIVSHVVGFAGAVLCCGDSGGPTYQTDWGRRYLVGVHSQGNLKDTNYDARLDTTAIIAFLKEFARKNHTPICGLDSTCGTL